MTYSIYRSNGNLLVAVPEQTINTSATSISLVGRGSINYGTSVNTNLVHLVENFASNVQPAHPLLGQTWYDIGNDRLSYYKPSGWVNVRVPEDYIMANIAGLAGNLSSVIGNTSANITNVLSVFNDGNVAITYVLQDLRSTINDNQSFVTELSQTFANANIALANSIMALGATFGANGNVTTSAGISDFAEAVATATSSYATRITTVESNVTTLTSNTSAWIRSTEQTLTTANSAVSSRIDTLFASVTTGNVTTSAGILDFAEAVANATSSYATQISGVTSTVGNLTSNVSTLSSSINGVSAKYGVTLNAGGHVAGFQILSGVTGPSEFIINADTFKIFTDDGSKNPFSVTGGNIEMNGNVSINGNLLVSGTVVTAAIATDAITINKIAPGASLPDYVRTYKGNEIRFIPVGTWLPLELDATSLNNQFGAVDVDAYRIRLLAGTYFYELSVPVKSGGSDTNDACFTAIILNPTTIANIGSYVTETVYGYKGDPGTTTTFWVPDPVTYTVKSTAGVNIVGDWQTATIFGVGRFTLTETTDISAAVTTTDGSPSMAIVAREHPTLGAGFCTTIIRIWRDYAV